MKAGKIEIERPVSTAASVVVGREWWLPMIGVVIVKPATWNEDRYL